MSSQLLAQESVIEGLKAERKLWGEELAQQGVSSVVSCYYLINRGHNAPIIPIIFLGAPIIPIFLV